MRGCRETLICIADGDTLRWIPAQCKRWSCEHCRPWLRHRVVRQIESGKPTAFATLTIKADREGSADDHATQLVAALKLLLKRLRRKYPHKQIEYFAVLERHKSGQPHIHLALRAPFIKQRIISAIMAELIGSPIVDIRQIKSEEQRARYMTKYLTKDPHKFERSRRYWCSRNYCLEKTDEQTKQHRPDAIERWERTSLNDVREAAQILQLPILRSSGGELVVRCSDREQLRRYVERLARLRSPANAAPSLSFKTVDHTGPPNPEHALAL